MVDVDVDPLLKFACNWPTFGYEPKTIDGIRFSNQVDMGSNIAVYCPLFWSLLC